MSYQTARDGIASLLNGLGYHEAPFDPIESPASTTAHKGFNIRVSAWGIEPMMHNVVHAQPVFNVAIWWVSKQNQQKDYDLIAASVEAIIAKLLNPANYASGDRIHRWDAGAIDYDQEKQLYQMNISIEVEYNVTLS